MAPPSTGESSEEYAAVIVLTHLCCADAGCECVMLVCFGRLPVPEQHVPQ